MKGCLRPQEKGELFPIEDEDNFILGIIAQSVENEEGLCSKALIFDLNWMKTYIFR